LLISAAFAYLVWWRSGPGEGRSQWEAATWPSSSRHITTSSDLSRFPILTRLIVRRWTKKRMPLWIKMYN